MAAAMGAAGTFTSTNPAGTNLTYSAEGRQRNALCGVVDAGQFSPPFPPSRPMSPRWKAAPNGLIVADASVPYIGMGVLREPVVCEVKTALSFR
jgi:hypothetical protein